MTNITIISALKDILRDADRAGDFEHAQQSAVAKINMLILILEQGEF